MPKDLFDQLLIFNSPPNNWIRGHKKSLMTFSALTALIGQIPWVIDSVLWRRAINKKNKN